METIKIKIINKSNNPLPTYAHIGDSGVDICAHIKDKEFIHLGPGDTKLIPTGLYSSIPEGYEIQIRSRSGFALKHNIFVLNAPGTIDSGYINEWGIILHNMSNIIFIIKNGDRIAQAVLCPVHKIEWETVTKLDETDRGLGGFGSTGV